METDTFVWERDIWVLTGKLKSKFQATEMKVLRLILGVTRLDRLRNTNIRGKLNVEPIVLVIEKNILRCFGYLMRMSTDRMPRRMSEWTPESRRPTVRPRKIWMDGVKDIIKRKNITLIDTKTMSQDRQCWRSFVRQLPTDRLT